MFAQADLYTTSYSTSSSSSGGFALFGIFSLFMLAIYIVAVVAQWKIFVKAGEEGWKALIPIYNFWTLCEIVGKPGWWSLSILFSLVPIINFIGWIVPLVVGIIVVLELGKAFGKDTVWSVFLLVIFSLIGFLILGFGEDKFDSSKLSSSTTGGGGSSGAPKIS